MSEEFVSVVEVVTEVAIELNPVQVVSTPGVPGDPIGSADEAVSAHEAETDPHPLYLNEARAAALYAPTVHIHGIADVTGLIAALAGKLETSQVGVAGGVAALDGSGKLNPSTLPALAITDTYLCASQAAMLASGADVGDVAIRSDVNKTFILRATPATTLANWSEVLTPTAAVSSVFGRVGAIAAQAGDYTFAQIGSKPTTVDGYGITDAIKDTDTDEGPTNSTVAKRNSSGDLQARLFRSTFADQVTMSGAIAFRINSSTDNYTRFCSDPAPVRTWLGIPAWDVNATASTLVQRHSSGYIFANYFNTTSNVTTAAPTAVMVETGSDGYIRKQTLAALKSNLGIYVQASDPGGVADGSLWIW